VYDINLTQRKIECICNSVMNKISYYFSTAYFKKLPDKWNVQWVLFYKFSPDFITFYTRM